MTPSGTLLVLGAEGQLGRQVVRAFTDAPATPTRTMGFGRIAGLSLVDLDITNHAAVGQTLAELRPTCLINCAAMTNVDACELEPQRCMQVNAEPLRVLAESCGKLGALLVQISTDFVFDGGQTRLYREDDPVGPLSVYGQSKLLAEEYAAACPHHLIVRTACLFGPGTANFVARMLARSLTGQELRIVHDRVGSPTYAPDLADGLRRLVAAGAEGLFHVVNAQTASWYDLAKAAVDQAGLPGAVHAITADQYPVPAARPAFSGLDTTRYQAATGHSLRPWPEALSEYVAGQTWMPS